MCWFIAGTLPKSASVPAVNAIVAPEGGRWRHVSDAAIHTRALRGFDFFDLTGGCGCGTALGSARRGQSRREDLPRAAARWSETKKRRWREQRYQLITEENAATTAAPSRGIATCGSWWRRCRSAPSGSCCI